MERTITLFPGSAETETSDEFLSISRPPTLIYPSFSGLIIQRPLFNASIHDRPELFDKIICPYNANAFAHLLDKHDLTSFYPDLITNLLHGFPLGPMPDLRATHIIPNHPTTLEYPSAVDDYLKVETGIGRTSGPFSHELVERILRGPFQSSPLIVAVQPQAPGEPDKLRICRHLSKSTYKAASVNSFISKHDFPTRFDTVIRVANMVSIHNHCSMQILLPETCALCTSFCRRLMLRACPSAEDLCFMRVLARDLCSVHLLPPKTYASCLPFRRRLMLRARSFAGDSCAPPTLFPPFA